MICDDGDNIDNDADLSRSVLRFVLLFKHNAGILPSPPIPSLKRDKLLHAKVKDCSRQESAIEVLGQLFSSLHKCEFILEIPHQSSNCLQLVVNRSLQRMYPNYYT